MRISLSTGSLYHRSASYSLARAQAAGYDGVELALGLGYTLRGLTPIEDAVSRQSLPVLSVHPPLRPLPGWPRAVEEQVARVATAARRFGAPICVIHAAMYASESSGRARRFASALELGARRAGEQVSIALENSQYAGRTRRWVLDDLATLTRYAAERGCGITLDTCHLGANRADVMDSYEIVRPVLRNIHLSDMRWHGNQPQTHLLPGEGELPLDRFLAQLAGDGYDGLITLELRPTEVGLVGRAHIERRLRQALMYVRTAIARPTSPPHASNAPV